MIPSANCINLIQKFEQCRLESYLPTPNDVWTIGWGSTGSDITQGLVWTQEQCDERFESDLNKFADGVNDLLNVDEDIITNQNQFDAMVSLAYNIGLNNFRQSTVFRDHSFGDYVGAAAAFSMWNKQKGVVLEGLVRRRAEEAALYEGTTT